MNEDNKDNKDNKDKTAQDARSKEDQLAAALGISSDKQLSWEALLHTVKVVDDEVKRIEEVVAQDARAEAYQCRHRHAPHMPWGDWNYCDKEQYQMVQERAEQAKHMPSMDLYDEVRALRVLHFAAPSVAVAQDARAETYVHALEQGLKDNGCEIATDEDGDVWVRNVRAEKAEAERADIATAVNRFLGWPLPASVRPDGCVMDTDYPNRAGTNLLTADEARAMFEYCLAAPSLPAVASQEQSAYVIADGLKESPPHGALIRAINAYGNARHSNDRKSATIQYEMIMSILFPAAPQQPETEPDNSRHSMSKYASKADRDAAIAAERAALDFAANAHKKAQSNE